MAYGEFEASGSKKRFVIMGISLIVSISIVFAVTFGVGQKSTSHDDHGSRTSIKSDGEISPSMQAITSICQPTTYQQKCMNSLLSSSENTTDPKKLVQLGFQVAMEQISTASKNSTLLQQLEKDPRATKALETCQELFELAVSDLKQAFDRLGNVLEVTRIDTVLMDLKIWTSATVTYQETCLDAFANSTSDAGKKMKMVLERSMHSTSNALAMVSAISSFLVGQGPNRHHLLADDDYRLHVLGHEDFELANNDYNNFNETWYQPAGFKKLLPTAASKADVHRLNKAANIIVAKDGSGKYTTINDALHHVPKHSNITFVIYIKEGIYNEHYKRKPF